MSDQSYQHGRGSDDDSGDERAWDEYDWERFLQQQDQKTEKYMELLEKYMDHPDRDALISKEMGWHHLLDENGKDWSEDLDALFSREMAQWSENESLQDAEEDEHNAVSPDASADAPEIREQHPLYTLASALTQTVERLFQDRESVAQTPAAVRLTSNTALACVKLAAALGDDDVDELGMTIAYLKRALKAITDALEAAQACEHAGLLDDETARSVIARIFLLRDGIVQLMGECRSEWRRRHGK
ncbi:MAG: hypothetical protein JO295_06750 [Verrucomicrobia bacterium]|nr:hypothetical protein [Verrucomicrobiota bacterium]